tara:strand:+ start:446 stop:592 length:147 start_codon:yes stop_codon:yes gene_type:complete
MAKNNGSGKTIYKVRDITGKIIEIDTSKMMTKKRDKRKLHKKGGRVKK